MNFQKYTDLDNSKDQAFLENFESHHNSDILMNLCKVTHQNQADQTQKHQMRSERAHENMSSIERQHNKSNPKQKKFYYKDKMAVLMPKYYVEQKYNYGVCFQSEQKAPFTKQEQLKRNRQSAKSSRQRKKEYVTILQQKNQENSKLIKELIAKLEQVTLERDRLKEENHQQIKDFFKSSALAQENLEKVIKNPKSSLEEIHYATQDMFERFGTAGSQRIAVMNYYINEILEELVSDIHKYFLNTQIFTKGITTQNLPKPIDYDVLKILEFDLPKIAYIRGKYKDRFIHQTSVFKDLVQQFYQIYKSVQDQGRVIQHIFRDLSKEIDARKLGQLIVWFEENKFCRQVKRVKREWIEMLKSGGEQTIQTFRKITKQS